MEVKTHYRLNNEQIEEIKKLEKNKDSLKYRRFPDICREIFNRGLEIVGKEWANAVFNRRSQAICYILKKVIQI